MHELGEFMELNEVYSTSFDTLNVSREYSPKMFMETSI
jgi:hypothetical protein